MKIFELLENIDPKLELADLHRRIKELNQAYIEAKRMNSQDWMEKIKDKLIQLSAKKMKLNAELGISEAATAGATSSGSIASLGQSPHVVLGRSQGMKSYTGSPGKSGTKAPSQPKPKKQKPSDNALNHKGSIIA